MPTPSAASSTINPVAVVSLAAAASSLVSVCVAWRLRWRRFRRCLFASLRHALNERAFPRQHWRLLDNVRQLVRQQLSSGLAFGIVLARSEHDILSDGEGLRPDLSRRLQCTAAGMHADIAEVVPEPRLEKGSCRRRQRLAVAA